MPVSNDELKSLIIKQNEGRDELKENLDGLSTKFEDFKDQYDIDMRGDTIPNGNKGIVNEIVNIKRILKESPSILALIQHHPFKALTVIFTAITVGLTAWFILHAFVSIPAVEDFFRDLFHIPVVGAMLFGP